MQKSEIIVQHFSVASTFDFDATVKHFEAQIGVFDPDAIKPVATASPENLRRIRVQVEGMAGTSGLMRFGQVEAHGCCFPWSASPLARPCNM